MQFLLYWNGTTYDLSKYVDVLSYTNRDRIDTVFDSGFITLKNMQGKQGVLDLERGLPRYSYIRVNNRYYYAGEYVVSKKNSLYTHNIPLLSLTKLMTRKSLPNMALTQVAGDIRGYLREINSIDKSNFTDFSIKTGYKNSGLYVESTSHSTIDYTVKLSANDPKIVERRLKAGRNYGIRNYVEIYNRTNFDPVYEFDYNLKFEILGNGQVLKVVNKVVKSATGSLFRVVPYIIYIDDLIDFTPSVDTTITTRISIDRDHVYIVDAGMTLYTEVDETPNSYNMDYWVERLLLEAGNEYFLSDSAKARLSDIESYEWTIAGGFDLYTALFQAGDHMGALPTVNLGDKLFYERITEAEYDASILKEEVELQYNDLLTYANTYMLDKPNNIAVKNKLPANINDNNGYYLVEALSYAESKVATTILNSNPLYEASSNDAMDYLQAQDLISYNNLANIQVNGQYIKVVAGTTFIQYFKVIKFNQDYVRLSDKRLVRILDYMFYDDMERFVINPPNVTAQTTTYDLENYVSELEINATNVIDRAIKYYPYRNGFAKLQALNKNTAITTENIGITLPNKIYKTRKFIVKGLDIETANRTVSEHDITRRVLNKVVWDTLGKDSSYNQNSRLYINRSQADTLYYVDGGRQVFNMGGVGTRQPQLIGQGEINRAIFEACAAEVAEKYDEEIINKDLGLETTENVVVQIEYEAYSDTRATVFKEDQTGFNESVIKHFDEIAQINDADILFNIAQQNVNRMGNMVVTKSGYVDDELDLMPIGSVDDNNYKLVSLETAYGTNRIDYTAQYVKDFSVVNYNKGLRTAIKMFQVPMDSIVKKIDKHDTILSLGNYRPDESGYLTDIQSPLKFLEGATYNSTFAEVLIDDKRFGTNVNEVRFKNAIVWNIEFEDNYSAGQRIADRQVGAEIVEWSEEVPYVDTFGNAEKVAITYLDTNQELTGQALKDYPLITEATGNKLANVEYNLNKDAREIFAHTHQLTYIGENGIQVYNITKEVDNLGFAVFDYAPSKQATYIDLLKVRTQENKTTVVENSVSVDLDHVGGVGFGWYDKDTNELMLFVKTNSNYFDYGYYGRTEAISLLEPHGFDTKVELVKTFSGNLGLSNSFSGSITASTEVLKGNFVMSYLSNKISLDANLVGNLSLGGAFDTSIETNASVIKGLFLNKELEASNTFNVISSGNLSLNGDIVAELSADMDMTGLQRYAKKLTTNAVLNGDLQGNLSLGADINYALNSDLTYDSEVGASIKLVWKRKQEVVNVCPPNSSGTQPAQGQVCYLEGERFNVSCLDFFGTNTSVYYVCEIE